MATAASRLSSSRAKARLALWLIAGAVLSALVVGYLVVDHGGGDDRRAAVASYIERANVVQRGLLTRLGSINTAYARLRLDPKAAAAQAPELAGAERSIASARARLAALEPPADARVLHRRLVTLLTLEQELARDVTALARHLSLITAGRQELATATAQLSKELQASTSGPAQAAAFGRYSVRLDEATARLSDASIPVLLRGSRRDEVVRLRRISGIADDLGRAISQADKTAVSKLLGQLEREVQDAAAVPGGRILVTAYNKRVKAIGVARTAVATELNRLDREL